MAFGHPSQHGHMRSGIERAIASPNTPAHLKPHLQKRLGGSMPKVVAKQGTANDKGGGGKSPQSLRKPSTVDNQTLGLDNKLRTSIDNVPKSQTRPSFQRTNKLSTVKRGFKKSKNMTSAPNAMFGEV